MADTLTPAPVTQPPARRPARPAYMAPRASPDTEAGSLAALGPAQAGGNDTGFGGP